MMAFHGNELLYLSEPNSQDILDLEKDSEVEKFS